RRSAVAGGDRIAILQPGNRIGQGWVSRSVDLTLVGGGYREWCPVNCERGWVEGQRVVATQGQGALRDGVRADVLAGGAGESPGDGVGVGQRPNGNMVGQ